MNGADAYLDDDEVEEDAVDNDQQLMQLDGIDRTLFCMTGRLTSLR